jgi:hypothetical protein
VVQRRHPSIRFRSPPRLPGTTQGLPPQSRERPVVPSIGRDYRTGGEEHPVKWRCRPRPGYASRSWACQGIPNSEDKICRFAACSAEAACRASRYAGPRAMLLLLRKDLVNRRTEEPLVPIRYSLAGLRIPSEGRIFDPPRAQGVRPVRAAVVGGSLGDRLRISENLALAKLGHCADRDIPA